MVRGVILEGAAGGSWRGAPPLSKPHPARGQRPLDPVRVMAGFGEGEGQSPSPGSPAHTFQNKAL